MGFKNGWIYIKCKDESFWANEIGFVDEHTL